MKVKTALKNILLFLPLFIFTLFLLLVIFHFGLYFIYTNKVYPGVSLGTTKLGGQELDDLDISSQLDDYSEETISFTLDESSFRTSLKQLQFQFDSEKTLMEIRHYGRSGNIWRDFQDEIKAIFGGATIIPSFYYDEEAFNQLSQVIGKKINHEAKDASLVIHENRVLVSSAEDKRELDEQRLRETFAKTVTNFQTIVTIPVNSESVTITNEMVHSKVPQAQKIIDSDLNLVWEDKKWVIASKDFVSFLTFKLEKNNQEVILTPEISNENYLQTKLEEIAQNIDKSMQEAVIKEINGQKFALQLPENGRVLDTEASIAKIREAFVSNQKENVSLVVTELNSEILAKEGIIDVSTLISHGESHFPAGAGQASRVHNIQTAASKLNDYVVPPDGVFSTIETLGEISTQTGYWGGLALIGGRYAPAVGGGVCELSTDLFRAAVYGGYEIVSRQNHSAVIFHYDWPQRGLDATIFPDSGLDFKFRNNTSYYLVLQTSVDENQGILNIDFYSKTKTREVTISESQIYNVVSPGTPLYITDASLGKGVQIMSEEPAPGCDVKIIRTMVENGQTKTEEILSHYTPWRAVYLVGE